MNDRFQRVLIVDTDQDTLVTLQYVLEQAEIDTTITWDEREACQLLATAPFDLILIGDHPPELNASAIIDDLSLRGSCPSVLILRAVISEKDVEHFHRLGASGVVQKGDPLAVLERVNEALAQMPPKQKSAKAAAAKALSFRAAS